MRGTQLHFFKSPSFSEMNRRAHGGDLRKGKRKLARPFDPKKPLHLVLRSTRARGEWSLLRTKNEKRVRNLVYREAARAQVEIFRYANAGNHLHLVVRSRNRARLARFLRTTSGLLARMITGAKKGTAFGRFWDQLAYSRIVEWGREFLKVCEYLLTNELEGLGWWEFGREKKRKAFS